MCSRVATPPLEITLQSVLARIFSKTGKFGPIKVPSVAISVKMMVPTPELFNHPNKIENVDRSDLRPSSDRYATVSSIDADRDFISAETVHQAFEENWAVHRAGSEHHPGYARFDKGRRGFQRANATPDLNGDVQGSDQPFDHFDISRFAGESRIQVYQMQAVASLPPPSV